MKFQEWKHGREKKFDCQRFHCLLEKSPHWQIITLEEGKHTALWRTKGPGETGVRRQEVGIVPFEGQLYLSRVLKDEKEFLYLFIPPEI